MYTECDKFCLKECSGGGPDSCKECSHGYEDIEGVCSGITNPIFV